MNAITVNQAALNSPIEGILPIPLTLPKVRPQFSLTISASGLSYELNTPLIGDAVINGNRYEASFAIDKHVVLILTLIGEQLKGGTEFRAERYLLNCKRTKPLARAQFIRSSLLAILGFAGAIDLKIPDWKFDSHLIFDLPLREISNQLQLRQLAYRMMIIERAIGKQFTIPEISSSQEIEFTNRIYHAIVDHSFIGPIDPIEHMVPAAEDALTWIKSYKGDTTQKYGPYPVSSTIFGQTISLGNATILVDDAFIVDADKARTELSKNDGHLVKIIISSFSGQGVYQTPDAPGVSTSKWDSLVDTLVSMDDQLSESLAERYQALAAQTLSGLSDHMKSEITSRPELDPEAFLPV